MSYFFRLLYGIFIYPPLRMLCKFMRVNPFHRGVCKELELLQIKRVVPYAACDKTYK
jgi:hypothetical protein